MCAGEMKICTRCAGALFEKGKLVERPDESGGDQQVA